MRRMSLRHGRACSGNSALIPARGIHNHERSDAARYRSYGSPLSRGRRQSAPLTVFLQGFISQPSCSPKGALARHRLGGAGRGSRARQACRSRATRGSTRRSLRTSCREPADVGANAERKRGPGSKRCRRGAPQGAVLSPSTPPHKGRTRRCAMRRSIPLAFEGPSMRRCPAPVAKPGGAALANS